MRGVQAQREEPDDAHDDRLERGEQTERDPVARQQVDLGDRQRHQSLERAVGALAQHRDRGDQEHDDEGEQAAHRRPDRLEGSGLAFVHVVHQREQRDRHHEQQRDGPRVAADLPQNAPGRGQRHAGAHEDARSMIARNARPRSCSPVCSRNR